MKEDASWVSLEEKVDAKARMQAELGGLWLLSSPRGYQDVMVGLKRGMDAGAFAADRLMMAGPHTQFMGVVDNAALGFGDNAQNLPRDVSDLSEIC